MLTTAFVNPVRMRVCSNLASCCLHRGVWEPHPLWDLFGNPPPFLQGKSIIREADAPLKHPTFLTRRKVKLLLHNGFSPKSKGKEIHLIRGLYNRVDFSILGEIASLRS